MTLNEVKDLVATCETSTRRHCFELENDVEVISGHPPTATGSSTTIGCPAVAPLSVEDAWLLRLDLDALTDKEIAEIMRYYKALKLPAPRDFEETRELIRRARDCKDIVHGWDDPADVSWWKDAFKLLKPPD